MAEAIISFGGGGTTSDELTATRDDVITGKTAVTSDSDDEAAVGTMPNHGAKNVSLNCGQVYQIPKGFHNGAGRISANSLASQTGGATAQDNLVLSPYTYWREGILRTGKMATMWPQIITPSTAQQVIYCANQYMASNITINAIPAHFLDITKNQSVFLNGGFGAIVNRGWIPARYVDVSMVIGNQSGLKQDTQTPATVGNGVIHTSVTYSDNQCGILILGSIDFSKFRTIRVTANGVTMPNSLTELRTAITDKNKAWVFSTTYKNGNQIILKAGWQTVDINISNITTNGYLYVGISSNSSASPKVDISEITLIP